MTERLRVEYSHKFSQKLGDDYDTVTLGSEWEFDIPDGVNVEVEYAKAYKRLQVMVDDHLGVSQTTKPVVVNNNVRTLPGERLTGTPTETEVAPIEEGRTYDFQNQKVWEVREETTRNNKPYVVVRVGRKGGDIPPKGYARVKTYNPYMINKLKALREGDLVDISGTFDGWDGRDGRQYDFVPTSVEKVRDVRAS